MASDILRVGEKVAMSSLCRPEKEQELTYTLLLELLVHQFCFPVRWIEIQDFLFDECGIKKIVEIGPSDILINMAKSTHDRKYKTHDVANSLHRELLSFASNKDQIYYSAEDSIPATKVLNVHPRAETMPASLPVMPQIAASRRQKTPKNIADVAIDILTIAKVIVCRGLKRRISEDFFGSTIRSLCGGRSTVQNEIIGDLEKEFGNLPDSPEDVPLGQLCTSLQGHFNGTLGQCSRTMIDRMVASKMPGAFNLTAVREYLQTEWGFESGRQDAILLCAVDAQPVSRMDSEDSAREFWTIVAESYIAEQKLTLASSSSEDSDVASSAEMNVDPKVFESLKKDQLALQRQLVNVYSKHLNLEPFEGDSPEVAKLRSSLGDIQADLNSWIDEHGPEYAAGVQQKFDSKKARIYDSSWNWALQDLLILYNELMSRIFKSKDDVIIQKRQLLLSKSSSRLIEMIKYLSADLPKDDTSAGANQWLSELLQESEVALRVGPLVRVSEPSTAPHTAIEPDGKILYFESIRPEPYHSTETFLLEMLGFETSAMSVSNDSDSSSEKKNSLSSGDSTETNTSSLSSNSSDGPPNPTFLSIETKNDGLWRRSAFLSDRYLDTLLSLNSRGLSFSNANVLVTGAGKGSIGAAVVKRLLTGGARVIVTTSSYSTGTTSYYQTLFAEFGGSGSTLMVLPFNQGSRQDVEALINYIYNLGDDWDLDHIIPFAAISERTQGIDDINSKTELAHRVMLINTLRLLGAVKRQKADRGMTTRPAQVILPLSPNHGIFGNDGLYAESKIGLQTLMQKWHSEDWGEYLSIVGTVIGWTRGTGLMSENDIVSEGIEKLGMRTFSQSEMAANILGLMSGAVLEASQLEPIIADLSGGMSLVSDLNQQVNDIRREIYDRSAYLKALTAENLSVGLGTLTTRNSAVPIAKRANIKFEFPRLPDYASEIQPLASLEGMMDLEKVVVVTGFAEVGPLGNARTRWEFEAYGEFSLEGCVELAWMMGLIEHDSIPSKSYSGWVDKKTREPITDLEVKAKYERHILDHTGIRFMEPRSIDGIHPKSKQFLHEIAMQEDLPSFEASRETAQGFLKEHGDNVRISQIEGSDHFRVTLRKGARLLVPKALKSCFVGGQIPAGWDAEIYGISKDIISQVDPTTLFALVCAAEALISSGITDPYEIYKYIHVSELGCCVGSGSGGVTSQINMYRERMLDQPVANDVLAEGFINSGAAWINMLLLSSSGPNITPVGACATAIESMSIGYDLITTGKAKAALVGGYDWVGKDIAYEFANMKATIDAEEDIARGRSPKEMSRPTTSTRKGFVESEGCGIQVLTTAKLALEMGLPIHGIVALAHTAFDKSGRSLPAPGQGILTTSRERKTQFDPPLLNMGYRKRCIDLRLAQIKETEASQLAYLETELESHQTTEGDTTDISAYKAHRLETIHAEALRSTRETLHTYGTDFWKQDNRISPIRGALATWGLTINDLDIASFHGTSTVKNELNEADVIQKQLKHLGRPPGNPIISVCQKGLTGHPKGAAGAWMFNGGLQILDTGLIPGNRNADNIDAELEKYDLIVFPNQSFKKADGVKAFSVTSFGFGQKGAQAIGVHPKYLFAALSADVYAEYCGKVQRRHEKAYEFFHRGLVGGGKMFMAKEGPPYSKEGEAAFLSDPTARVPMGA